MTGKKLIKHSLIYVVLGFLPLAINFVLAPIYSRFISPEEYGIVALASVFQSILAVILSMGLDGAFSRLYFDYNRSDKMLNALMSSILISVVGLAVMFGVVLYFTGDYIFSIVFSNSKFTYFAYGQLVFFTTISTIIHSIFLSYYRNREQVRAYSVVALSFFFTTLIGIVIGVIVLRAEALGNIAGKALGASTTSIVLVVWYYAKHKLSFKKTYLRKCLQYSLPIVPYLLLLAAYNNVDKYMVERFFELSDLGLYNFAFLLASVLSVLIYAIFNAVSPHIYKQLTNNFSKKIGEVKQVSSYYHLGVMAIICLSIMLINPTIDLFINYQYASIKSYISLLLIVYVFQLYYVLYTIPIFYSKKTSILPWISLGVLLVGVLSNFLLIPIYGIIGVCFALFVTKLSQFTFAYAYVKRRSIPSTFLDFKKNHLMTLVIVVTYVIGFVIHRKFEVVDISVLNFLPFLIFVVSIVLFFNAEIRLLINTMKSNRP